MSTPRRRPSPAVYRRRRLVVLLVLVTVVAAVVLALWQPWRSAAAPGAAPTPSGSTSAPAASIAPSEAAAEPAPSEPAPSEPAPSEPAPAEPAPSASGTAPVIAPCTTGDISVLAVTDKDSYGAGELPQLSIALSNTSANPCLINVGTATQSFVISSGSDIWWRSTDCQSDQADQVVQLAAGQTVSSVTPLAWDRTRSSVDTCGGASRPNAPAGYFHLQVSIGGIQGADTKMFRLR